MKKTKRRWVKQGGRDEPKIRAIDGDGKLHEFRTFENFFNLPFELQEGMVLWMDPKTIVNLCQVASRSKRPEIQNFYREVCENYKFWARKFKRDFPNDYEDVLVEMYFELMADYGDYLNMTMSGMDIKPTKESGKFLLQFWTGAYQRYYEGLIKIFKSMISGIGDDITLDIIDKEENPQIYFENILKRGVDPNMNIRIQRRSSVTKPALNMVIEKNDLIRTKILLKYGANPNNRDTIRDKEWTALHEAVQTLREDFVKVVLESDKVIVDIKDRRGNTPLMIAVSDNSIEIANMLLEARADPTSRNTSNKTPLSLARIMLRMENTERRQNMVRILENAQRTQIKETEISEHEMYRTRRSDFSDEEEEHDGRDVLYAEKILRDWLKE